MNAKSVETSSDKKQSSKGYTGDSFPLIETKIQVPYRRADLLLRSRLVNFLHASLDRKLIIVSAPAGYGKTALLVDFANDTDLNVCWYTIDAHDKDLRVFLEYLIAAIAYKFPGFGKNSLEILKQIPDPAQNMYAVVATLVQEINEKIQEYFIIVLDDHQTIEEQDHINEFLDSFISYLDENCHVIVASRSLPAFPNLALLIARQQSTGIGIEELRFTASEIQNLALQNYDVDLDYHDAAALADRTGGWITGLQLTSPNQWTRSSPQGSVEQVNYHIYEYLSKQVLNQQPEELQNFLLDSSVLYEITPSVCKSLLGIEKPNQLIDQVRSRNLFVIEFEGIMDTLRYHDLFRQFLLSNLCRRDEARYNELILRAADYYASLGEWERAISRYRMLGAHEDIAEIVVQISQLMFDTGRWNTLAEWIDALPDSYLDKKPDLLIFRAKIHAERGDHTAALNLFARAEKAFSEQGNKSKAAQALAMKGFVLRYQGHYAEAIAQCQQAFALVTGDNPNEQFAIALAHKNIGLSLIRLGQPVEGRQALNRALYLFEELVNPHDIGMIHHDLGLSLELTGDLNGAIQHYQAALENWEQLGNLSPWANTLNGLGVVYYQKGEFELAEKMLKEALDKSQNAKDLRIEAYTLASLGDLYRDIGDYKQAYKVFRDALEISHRAKVGFVITYALDGIGNLACLQGDYQTARNRLFEALELAISHDSAFEIGLCNISIAVTANCENQVKTAIQHLDQAIDVLDSSGFKQQLSRAKLHRGYSALLFGNEHEALEYLDQSLQLCDQIGNYYFMLTDALQARPLLIYAIQQDFKTKTVEKIIDRIDSLVKESQAKFFPTVQIQKPPALKIYGFDKPEVILDNKIVQWSVAKSRDLFFFLLQHPKGQSKEQIGAIFWPDHGPERLDSAFRSTVYRLRRVVYRDIIIFDNGLYRFNWSSDYWYDVQLFEAYLDQARGAKNTVESCALYEKALALYRGNYLQGIYYDWAETERTRFHARFMLSLEKLAGVYTEQRKLNEAITLYKRLLNEDRFNESAHRELMRCYYRQGDRAAAIRQYNVCLDTLRKELKLSPAQETENLYIQIIS